MSERFEDQLARATELAAHEARLSNPSAIRARGDRRTRRRRSVEGALGIAVAAAIGLGTTLSLNSPSTHHAPVASPTTISAPPTSSSPATTPPTTPAHTTPPAAGTTTQPTGTTGTSTTPTTSTTAPNPGQYVAGAWLSASQMPYGSQIAWQQSTSLLGSRVGGAVFEVTDIPSDGPLSMNDCSGATFTSSLKAAQYQEFNGPNNGAYLTSTAIADYSTQGIYFYPNAGAASAAWSGVTSDMDACARMETGTDATGTKQVGSVERTSDGATEQCWSSLVAYPNGSPTSGTLYHTCYVISGDLIEWANVTVNHVGSFSQFDVGSTDATTVANIDQSLSAYGG